MNQSWELCVTDGRTDGRHWIHRTHPVKNRGSNKNLKNWRTKRKEKKNNQIRNEKFWTIYKIVDFGPKINKNGQNQQNQNFPNNDVWSSLYPLMPSNFMQNIKKIQWANFEQYTKKWILSNCSAHFCTFLGPYRHFSRKVTTSSLTSYGILSLCKKI